MQAVWELCTSVIVPLPGLFQFSYKIDFKEFRDICSDYDIPRSRQRELRQEVVEFFGIWQKYKESKHSFGDQDFMELVSLGIPDEVRYLLSSEIETEHA